MMPSEAWMPADLDWPPSTEGRVLDRAWLATEQPVKDCPAPARRLSRPGPGKAASESRCRSVGSSARVAVHDV